MIKNETQYRQTKAQIIKFENALEGVNNSDQELHPIQKRVYQDALRSQHQELVKQSEEYELLKNGQIKLFQVSSFEELPITLIKARIASGLTQKDLADLLGMKEQQVQRYEATNYESASFDRLKEVVNALGVKITKEILISENTISLSVFFKNLESLGFKKDFVLQKLLPSKLSSFLEGIVNQREVDLRYFTLQASAIVGKIFNISPTEFLNPTGPPNLNVATAYATKFKKPKNVSIEKIAPYTIYAHTLAISILEGCKHLEIKSVPTDVQEFRQSILNKFGKIDFEAVLRYAWSLGIPVLPLGDSKNFHGACWRIDKRNVIVLKQKNKSSVRWLFDLIHEICHAGQYPELPSLEVIEISDNFDKEMANLEDEKDANWFAGQVLLKGEAHILSAQAINEAHGNLQFLSSAVMRLSKKEGVDTGALANFIAFRLSAEQGKNWWGSATNLQTEDDDPLEMAKNIFFENVKLEEMPEFERELVLNALK
jgi:transcriptional regulator with XRE-family HTH domain/Zn-dependent peptidase ImmA (M78 family)